MMHRRIAIGIILLAAGCGDGTPPMDTSQSQVKVSGIVKVKGKPVSGGQIKFDPSNALRQVGSFTAEIGPDGTYSAVTYTGENVVRFSGAMLKANPEIGLTTRFCNVTAAENVFDFDLLGETDQVRGPTYSRKGAKTGKR
ncbi:hypothetical protein P12x_002877 [Tundrisphaera lichenicola]|uniref:hypothetical protein n=1 Tax=Tundrisphaera lichenicola TaxID=2029860 RepID=UPI003EB79582